MASKRANAIKQIQAQEALNDRMAAIERSQALIMKHLGIEDVPVVEDEIEPEAPETETDLEPIDETPDYKSMNIAALKAEAIDRGIYDDIIGTGSNGNVITADLIAALVEYDEAAEE